MRKVVRAERMRLVINQERIYQNNCLGCPFRTSDRLAECKACDIYPKLNAIGSELERLSASDLKLPEELSWKTFLFLQDREWSISKIARHYSLGATTMQDFINEHRGSDIQINAIDVVLMNEQLSAGNNQIGG